MDIVLIFALFVLATFFILYSRNLMNAAEKEAKAQWKETFVYGPSNVIRN